MGRSNDERWTEDVVIVVSREQDRAILVEYEGEEEWIPKSLIEGKDYQGMEKGETLNLDIPLWKAEEIGWG
jgi:hypothetical protein